MIQFLSDGIKKAAIIYDEKIHAVNKREMKTEQD